MVSNEVVGNGSVSCEKEVELVSGDGQTIIHRSIIDDSGIGSSKYMYGSNFKDT